MQAEVQANRILIQELAAQVSSLIRSLKKVLTLVVNAASWLNVPHHRKTGAHSENPTYYQVLQTT